MLRIEEEGRKGDLTEEEERKESTVHMYTVHCTVCILYVGGCESCGRRMGGEWKRGGGKQEV